MNSGVGTVSYMYLILFLRAIVFSKMTKSYHAHVNKILEPSYIGIFPWVWYWPIISDAANFGHPYKMYGCPKLYRLHESVRNYWPVPYIYNIIYTCILGIYYYIHVYIICDCPKKKRDLCCYTLKTYGQLNSVL